MFGSSGSNPFGFRSSGSGSSGFSSSTPFSGFGAMRWPGCILHDDSKPSVYVPPPTPKAPVKVGAWTGVGAGVGAAAGAGAGAVHRYTSETRKEPASSTLIGAGAGAYACAKLARTMNVKITESNKTAAEKHWKSPEVMKAKKTIDSRVKSGEPMDAVAFKTVKDAADTIRATKEAAETARKKSSSWWPW